MTEELKTKYNILKSNNKKVWENCLDFKRKFKGKVNELENKNDNLSEAKAGHTDINKRQKYTQYWKL